MAKGREGQPPSTFPEWLAIRGFLLFHSLSYLKRLNRTITNLKRKDMEREELLKYCRYYKGEEACPFENDDDKCRFWFGELQWVKANAESKWTEYGREIRQQLKGEKAKSAARYSDVQFGIIIFIETLFSKNDPYDDLHWIYNY